MTSGRVFAVRAYVEDSIAEVAVADGRVEVPGGTILAQGQLAHLSASRSVDVRSGVNLDDYFAWTEGRLVFRRTPLREALARLGRWYDLDIRLTDDRFGVQPLTATLEDEPPSAALSLIAMTFKLRLSREGRSVILSPK